MKKRSLFNMIAISLVMSLLVADPVWATTSTDLQEKQEKLENEQKELENQKKALENQKKDSQNKLNNANSQISDYSEAQGETKEAIDETNAEKINKSIKDGKLTIQVQGRNFKLTRIGRTKFR